MTNHNPRNFLESRLQCLTGHFEKAKEKYEEIWSYYEVNMPRCISKCLEKKKKASVDGPQGIYWIGETPKIFIIGREHFGWYGPTSWETGKEFICYSPIEFAFFTVPSMGTYWATVKDLLCHIFSVDLGEWDFLLKNSAFSNSCKCFSNDNTYKRVLQQQCFDAGYCRKEIEIVQAPVNLLFTKSYNLAKRLFPEYSTEIEKTSEFLVMKANRQFIIESAHPGRKSNDWRKRLKELVEKYCNEK